MRESICGGRVFYSVRIIFPTSNHVNNYEFLWSLCIQHAIPFWEWERCAFLKIYWSPASVTYNKPQWFARQKQHACRPCLLSVYKVVYKWLNQRVSLITEESSEELEWLQPLLRCHQLPQNDCRDVHMVQLCMNLGAFTVACHLIQEEVKREVVLLQTAW